MIQEKLPFIWPEIALFIATCVVMVLGLSPTLAIRRLCSPVAGLGLVAAGFLAFRTPDASSVLAPGLMSYSKIMIAAVGFLLLLLAAGTVDRTEERAISLGRQSFNPLRTNRAEFYAFFLFSLTGLMLCASADDLVWLFLALELTSLPTYMMVTISAGGLRGGRSHEAGVKYFFLGALGAATFLYGFALIYGGTGSTSLVAIRDVLAVQASHGASTRSRSPGSCWRSSASASRSPPCPCTSTRPTCTREPRPPSPRSSRSFPRPPGFSRSS